MSKREKLYDRIMVQMPVPKDITPDELIAFAHHMGWETRYGSGDHVVLIMKFPDGTNKPYPIPLGGKKTILSQYIREIRKRSNHDNN